MLGEQARRPSLIPAPVSMAHPMGGSRWAAQRRWLRRLDSAAIVGLVLTMLFVLAAVLAPLVTPHDALAQDVSRRLKPPGWVDARTGTYLLGTDGLGRDILSRL